MWVKFCGHNDILLTDYNGKRYAFHKNKPKEVPSEVYNSIVRSGNVDAAELQVCDAPVAKPEEAKEEVAAERPKAPKVKKTKKTVKTKSKKKSRE